MRKTAPQIPKKIFRAAPLKNKTVVSSLVFGALILDAERGARKKKTVLSSLFLARGFWMRKQAREQKKLGIEFTFIPNFFLPKQRTSAPKAPAKNPPPKP